MLTDGMPLISFLQCMCAKLNMVPCILYINSPVEKVNIVIILYNYI